MIKEPRDLSGSIKAGGTAQTLSNSRVDRYGFTVQNNSSGDLWVSAYGPATIGGSSIKIPAGGLYGSPAGCCSSNALSIIGATTGQAFFAEEW